MKGLRYQDHVFQQLRNRNHQKFDSGMG